MPFDDAAEPSHSERPYKRRRRDDNGITIGELARRLDRHEQTAAQLHRDAMRLISKLDARTDALTTRISIVFAVVAVLWAIFLVFAPLIRVIIGAPSGG